MATGDRVVRPAAPVRRPRPRPVAHQRPGGRPLSYGPGSVRVGVSRAPHGRPTAEQARRRLVALGSAVVLLAVLLVVGLSALAAGGVAPVPSATTVVQVQPGESLSEVAVRVAPESSSTEVAAAIRELNGLTGSGLRAGQSLVVPAA